MSLYNYIDVDLTFLRHPGTKDVFKKYDHEAVKQALRNIFLTNKLEKPFDPNFGLGLERLLFEPNMVTGGIFSNFLQRKIEEMITEYEPRCIIDELIVEAPEDSNAITINLSFHTIMNPQQDQLSFSFRKAR